jgi:hypothetical protein
MAPYCEEVIVEQLHGRAPPKPRPDASPDPVWTEVIRSRR